MFNTLGWARKISTLRKNSPDIFMLQKNQKIHPPSLHSVSRGATTDGAGRESAMTLAISFGERGDSHHTQSHAHKLRIGEYIPVCFSLRTHCIDPYVV